MGNTNSTSGTSSSSRRRGRSPSAAERAKRVVGDIQEEFKRSVKTFDDDHPAAQLIDSVCGGYLDPDASKYRHARSASFYSEADYSEDESRTVGDDDTFDDSRVHQSRRDRDRDGSTVESASYISQSDYESEPRRKHKRPASFDTEDDTAMASKVTPVEETPQLLAKPLASSFAKRCYFTKAGIGKTTQHYEGLTLTGNVVLMLAAAMKLKGCPTICDEDLRRVEQTYPNQFSRLPDELLLSSGWRRISKYCHFSNKPIPDGIPFFHSKQRVHPSGGYYFLLASAVGMVRPIDVEPLTKDTLVLLETDFPTQCDQCPPSLVSDPEEWTLVDKFCFFSGGPINTEEDVYYQADFDGSPIYMLAFLSPSLTPEELYKLGHSGDSGLKTVAAVEEVESVYDLTERDFEDLKLYHLGPCRALPHFVLTPEAWVKILPPHFLAAKEEALQRAHDYQAIHGEQPRMDFESTASGEAVNFSSGFGEWGTHGLDQQESASPSRQVSDLRRQIEEEGAFSSQRVAVESQEPGASPVTRAAFPDPETPKLDPPEDEPPSLMKRSSAKTEESRDPSIGPSLSVDSVNDKDPLETENHFFPTEKDENGFISSPGSQDFDAPDDHRFMNTADDNADFGSPDGHNNYFDDDNYNMLSPGEMSNPISPGFMGEEKKASEDDQYEELGRPMAEGENDFTPIKRDGYSLNRGSGGPSPSPKSQASTVSSQSAALRGAQELLRKNRRRRMEMASKTSMSAPGDTSDMYRNALENSGSPRDDQSETTWESGSELTSVISSSSVWTDGSNPADRSSRRALILQMAKARMKSNKEGLGPTNPSYESSNNAPVDEASAAAQDIDLTGDLD